MFARAVVNNLCLRVSIFDGFIMIWGGSFPIIKKGEKEIKGIESLNVFDFQGNILIDYLITQEDYEIRRR